MMNIERQFSDSIRNVSNGTAMKLPREEADCKRPVAKPLSRRPNQSRTTRAPPGNRGASPTPSARRATTNIPKLLTKPPTACAADQQKSPSQGADAGRTDLSAAYG